MNLKGTVHLEIKWCRKQVCRWQQHRQQQQQQQINNRLERRRRKKPTTITLCIHERIIKKREKLHLYTICHHWAGTHIGFLLRVDLGFLLLLFIIYLQHISFALTKCSIPSEQKKKKYILVNMWCDAMRCHIICICIYRSHSHIVLIFLFVCQNDKWFLLSCIPISFFSCLSV